MTILLVYKRFKRKTKSKKFKYKYKFVGRIPLLPGFRNEITFIKWVFHMLKGGEYRVQTRLPTKRGFTPLIKFGVSKFYDDEGKAKLRIRTLDDNWDLLKNFK